MRNLFKELKKNRGAFISLIIIASLLFIAILADILALHSPYTIYENASQLKPQFSAYQLNNQNQYFFLGTDDLGRDLMSRIMHGARVSLMVGFTVVFISASIGTFLGAIAGYFGGLIDRIIMRLTDIIMSIPSILFAIVIVAVIGQGIKNAIFAVSFVAIPNFIRIVRAQVLVEKNKQYVYAAQLFGAHHWRIIFKEILPNCMAPIIVQCTLGFSDGILNCAALGFLGLGAEAPIPEWELC